MSQTISESSNGCKSYGIFWDIENCPIPPLERAANVVQSIKLFIKDKYESSAVQTEPCVFCCSCDTRALDLRHVEGLNRYGVDILHVNSSVPNGTRMGQQFKVDADSKLMECIQKFVDHHMQKNRLFVITGDIDFAPAIRSAKRRGFEVILLFGTNTANDLKNCATEAHSYIEIIHKYSDSSAPSAVSGPSYAVPLLPRTSSISNAVNSEPMVANSQPDVSRRSNNPSLPPMVANVVETVRQMETQNKSRSQTAQSNSRTNESTTGFDAQKLKTIEEIAHVDRHIAVRVLETCNGNVELALNLILPED